MGCPPTDQMWVALLYPFSSPIPMHIFAIFMVNKVIDPYNPYVVALPFFMFMHCFIGLPSDCATADWITHLMTASISYHATQVIQPNLDYLPHTYPL